MSDQGTPPTQSPNRRDYLTEARKAYTQDRIIQLRNKEIDDLLAKKMPDYSMPKKQRSLSDELGLTENSRQEDGKTPQTLIDLAAGLLASITESTVDYGQLRYWLTDEDNDPPGDDAKTGDAIERYYMPHQSYVDNINWKLQRGGATSRYPFILPGIEQILKEYKRAIDYRVNGLSHIPPSLETFPMKLTDLFNDVPTVGLCLRVIYHHMFTSIDMNFAVPFEFEDENGQLKLQKQQMTSYVACVLASIMLFRNVINIDEYPGSERSKKAEKYLFQFLLECDGYYGDKLREALLIKYLSRPKPTTLPTAQT